MGIDGIVEKCFLFRSSCIVFVIKNECIVWLIIFYFIWVCWVSFVVEVFMLIGVKGNVMYGLFVVFFNCL